MFSQCFIPSLAGTESLRVIFQLGAVPTSQGSLLVDPEEGERPLCWSDSATLLLCPPKWQGNGVFGCFFPSSLDFLVPWV